MIKPTIGRVVLVFRGQSDQAEPALISYVWNDELINVGGFTKNGTPFNETSLPLVQDDSNTLNTRYATWMPYQKGQAVKAEALEAKLAEAAA